MKGTILAFSIVALVLLSASAINGAYGIPALQQQPNYTIASTAPSTSSTTSMSTITYQSTSTSTYQTSLSTTIPPANSQTTSSTSTIPMQNHTSTYTTTTQPTSAPTTTINPANAITFTETGLPGGAYWTVSIYSSTYGASAPSPIIAEYFPGNYSYTVHAQQVNSTVYFPSPSYGSFTTGGSVAITFSTTPPQSNSITTTFTEKGLPNDAGWTVGFNCSAQGYNGKGIAPAPIHFQSKSQGACQFRVYSVLSNRTKYYPTPSAGALQAGSNTVITFSTTPPSNSVTTFYQTGLPSNTLWTVKYGNTTYFTNSSSPASIFSPIPGNYPFIIEPAYSAGTSYYPVPYSGMLQSGRNITIAFSTNAPPETKTVFTANGLPSGAEWGVLYNGGYGSAYAPNQIVFYTESRPYAQSFYYMAYTSIYNSTTYYPLPASGQLTAGNTLQINFSAAAPANQLTTFTEAGLPVGARWSVSYAGQANSASGSAPNSITVYYFRPGNHNFRVFPAYLLPSNSYAGTQYYYPTPAFGNATSGSTVPIGFSANALPSEIATFFEKGLPNGVSWSVRYNGQNTSAIAPNSILVYTPYPVTAAFTAYPVIYNSMLYNATPQTGNLPHGGSMTINYTGSYFDYQAISPPQATSFNGSIMLETPIQSSVESDINMIRAISFSNAETSIGVYVSSSSPAATRSVSATQDIRVSNITATAPPAPSGLRTIVALNISTSPLTTTIPNVTESLNISMHYNCSISSTDVVPYMVSSGRWSMLSSFSFPEKCTISYRVPADPIVALMYSPNQSTSPTTVEPTSTVPATPSQQPAPYSDYAYILVVAAVIAAIALAGRYMALRRKPPVVRPSSPDQP